MFALQLNKVLQLWPKKILVSYHCVEYHFKIATVVYLFRFSLRCKKFNSLVCTLFQSELSQMTADFCNIYYIIMTASWFAILTKNVANIDFALIIVNN